MRSAASALAGALRGWAAGLMELVFPGVCPGCESAAAGAGLCDACSRRLLSLVALPYCPRCGATLGPDLPAREEGCGACPTVLGRFVRVVRLGPYADPLRSVVRELKYRRRDAMRRRLGRMLGQAVAAQCGQERFDVVVPAAMHWRRRLLRGWDHAAVLAGAVARELGAPMGEELLRVRPTRPQVHLSRARRVENVRGAFAARKHAALRGASVLLVDDVTTTGATADEAAKALRKAGALRVTLAVVCKAEPPTAYGDYFRP